MAKTLAPWLDKNLIRSEKARELLGVSERTFGGRGKNLLSAIAKSASRKRGS